MARIDRAGRIALLLAAVFLVAQAWLVWRAAVETPADRVFLGYPHIPTDHYAYRMMTEQSREHGLLFVHNLFTTQPQNGRFLMSGLAVTGWIERFFPADAHAQVWHALRLAALAALALLLWRLCRALFGGRTPDAPLAFGALLFSGGLDWTLRLAVAAGTMAHPAGEWLENPWNFNLLWTGTLATWVWPLAGLIGMVLLEIRSPSETLARGLLRGLAFAALWSVHPYSALLYAALIATHVIAAPVGNGSWARRIGPSLLPNLAILIGVGLVGTYALWAREDAVYRLGSDQVRLWRLWYWPYLWPIVYGPQIVLAAFGLGRDRDGEHGFRWIQVWLAATVLMSINPLVTGAKFQFLITVPLVLLEVRGALRLARRWIARIGASQAPAAPSRPGSRRLVMTALLGVLAVGATGGFVEAMVRDLRSPIVRDAAEADPNLLEALAVLRAAPAGGVLCHPTDGAIVPWKALKPVFVGQWFLSTRFGEKVDLVRWFVQGPADDPARRDFLAAARVRYVLETPRLRQFGPMPAVAGLDPIFRSATVTLWELAPPL